MSGVFSAAPLAYGFWSVVPSSREYIFPSNLVNFVALHSSHVPSDLPLTAHRSRRVAVPWMPALYAPWLLAIAKESYKWIQAENNLL